MNDTRMKSRWNRFAHTCRFSYEEASHVFSLLDTLYGEPHRKYHNWTHIHSLLTVFETWKAHVDDPLAFEAAIWFHDALYTPGRTDNEENSAYLAESLLSRSLMEDSCISTASAIIRSTDYMGTSASMVGTRDSAGHTQAGTGKDHDIFHDLDFAIFASPVTLFFAYDSAILAEYTSLGAPHPEKNRLRRKQFLQNLLNRTTLFLYPPIHTIWEVPARENIKILLKERYHDL